ncbi:MAG: energy-coupling factor transporter transmembrane component T [Anaerolineae bacterium]|jgi:energy-coupling factor transport system permease protein
MFHTWSWVAWLFAAAVPAFTLRNPLYSVLILGAVWIVYMTVGRSSPISSTWGGFVKIGLFLLILTIPFNALALHAGRLVLFRLPESWPIVGGAITLEAIITGAANGLALLTILIVFAAFNAVADHYQLLRATPPFLFQVGVVISIAITFVPQMVLSAKEIRESQRIRGHRFRGIRDLLPLVLPLLASGLERSIQLAETMEARGFGSTVSPLSQRQATATQGGTLAALLGLLAGLLVVAYFPERSSLGWVLVGLGGFALLAMFWLQGRRVHRTRYRRERWQARDTALVLGSAVVLVAVVVARLTAPETLFYSPFPPSSLLPPFNAYVGAALLLLALPALLAPSGQPFDYAQDKQ